MNFLTSTTSLLLCVLFCAEEIHSQNVGDLRLVQQDVKNFDFTAGRLEIYINSTWGSICADNFEMHDADVACKQLGFSRALHVATSFHTPYGRGREGPVWLDEVECKGDDLVHILSCSHVQQEEIDCDHFSDVAIECSSDPTEVPVEEELSVRLVGEKFASQGIVEVHCNNSWAPICPPQGTILSKSEGDAICRQLGYTESVRYNLRDDDDNYATSRVSPVSFQDYECHGDARNLASCGATCSSSVEGVTSNEVVGSAMVRGPGCVYLECAHTIPYGTLRLSNDTTRTAGTKSGRLEVFKDGVWGSVCYNGFNMEAANVSCRQLGFAKALYYGFSEEEGYGRGGEDLPIFGGANCSPYNSKLVECINLADAICTHSDDVAIFCSSFNDSTLQSSPLDPEAPRNLPFEVFVALIVGPCLLLIMCCACTAVCSIHLKLVPYDTMKKPASHGLYFTEYEGSNLTLNEMNLEKMLESPASKKLQKCNEKNIMESDLGLDLDSKCDAGKKYKPALSPSEFNSNIYTTLPTPQRMSPVNVVTSPVPQPSILGRQPSNTHEFAGVTSPRLHRKFTIPSTPKELPPPSPILSGPVPPPLVVKRNLVIRRNQDQMHTAVDMTTLTSPTSTAESKPAGTTTTSNSSGLSMIGSWDIPWLSSANDEISNDGATDQFSEASTDSSQPMLMRPAPQKGIRKLKTLSQISEINLEAVAINDVSDSYREMSESSASSAANSKGNNTHRVSFKLE